MIRLGIICPSEIAYRRFLPAVSKHDGIEYVGVACASIEEWYGDISEEIFKSISDNEHAKALKFVDTYGGKVFDGYRNMILSGEIDAVYLPLPPALHYKWAKIALTNGLHAFIEKPSTTSLNDTKELVNIAKLKGLVLHENYMFAYHSQLEEINNYVKSGAIGDARMCRIDFGFPFRGINDFRYIKALGGGALLDCGGYTLKYANMLLGGNAKVIAASMEYKDGIDVDIFGTGTLVNDSNQVVQLAFGMDNDYRCNVDIWGSKGTLISKRVLTAPEGYEPSFDVMKNGVVETYTMKADDAFFKSIEKFVECIYNNDARFEEYGIVLKQESLVDEFLKISSATVNVNNY